ncbi:MAG: DUF2807 domain-containing protein [Bacteroidia bacterium]
MAKQTMLSGQSDTLSNMKQLALLIMVLLLLQSCSDAGDCFYGTGSPSTEERSLDTIRGIYLTSNINLIIHPNQSNFRMRVTGGSHLLKKVSTSISNGTLSIKNNNRCNWVRSFKSELTVEIWIDKLNAIYLENSTGDVNVTDTLKTDNFRFDCFGSMGSSHLLIDCPIATVALHNGPADITVAGKTGVQYNYNAGFGKIDCRELISQDIYITNKGTNNTWVNSTSLLEATITHSGNIYYTGQPSIIKRNITGKGQLIKF